MFIHALPVFIKFLYDHYLELIWKTANSTSLSCSLGFYLVSMFGTYSSFSSFYLIVFYNFLCVRQFGHISQSWRSGLIQENFEGPNCTLPTGHQSYMLQRTPFMDCMHPSVVAWLTTGACWSGLVPSLIGCQSVPLRLLTLLTLMGNTGSWYGLLHGPGAPGVRSPNGWLLGMEAHGNGDNQLVGR